MFTSTNKNGKIAGFVLFVTICFWVAIGVLVSQRVPSTSDKEHTTLFYPESGREVTERESRNFKLADAESRDLLEISGRLVNWDGSDAQSGITIEARNQVGKTYRKTKSNEYGRFTFPPLQEGRVFEICVEDPHFGLISSKVHMIRVGSPASRESIEMRLIPACVVLGQVHSVAYPISTSRKYPIEGQKIDLISEGRDRIEASVVTDESGRFQFPLLRPGSYRVRAESPADAALPFSGSAYVEKSVELQAPGVERTIEIAFEMGSFSISGSVFDESGVPIDGCEIRVRPYPSLDNVQGRLVRTDSNGRYLFKQLPLAEPSLIYRWLQDSRTNFGLLEVIAKKPGYSSARMVVPAFNADSLYAARDLLRFDLSQLFTSELRSSLGSRGTVDNIDFKLSRSASLALQVLDSNSTPCGNCLVHVESKAMKLEEPFTQVSYLPGHVFADKSGIFKLDDLLPGNYSFKIVLSGEEIVRIPSPDTIAVEAIGAEYRGILEVPAASSNWTLEGDVRSRRSNEPIERFVVRIERSRPLGKHTPSLSSSQVGGSQGKFRIEGQGDAELTLKLTADGFAEVISKAIVADGSTTELEVELNAESVLRGRVSTSIPFRFGRVHVYDPQEYARPVKSAPLHGGDPIELNGLGPGTYIIVVEIQYKGDGQIMYYASEALTINEGYEYSLLFTLRSGDGEIAVDLLPSNVGPIHEIFIMTEAKFDTNGTPDPTAILALARVKSRELLRIPNLPAGEYYVAATKTVGTTSSGELVRELAAPPVAARVTNGATVNIEL